MNTPDTTLVGAMHPTAQEIRATIEERLAQAIVEEKQFSLDGFPELSDQKLIPILKALFCEYAAKNDADRFLILFHTFKYVLDTPALEWGTDAPQGNLNSINLKLKEAIKALWEDRTQNVDGDALLRVAMKLGIIKQNEVQGIRDMVGVSDTTARDRM